MQRLITLTPSQQHKALLAQHITADSSIAFVRYGESLFVVYRIGNKTVDITPIVAAAFALPYDNKTGIQADILNLVVSITLTCPCIPSGYTFQYITRPAIKPLPKSA